MAFYKTADEFLADRDLYQLGELPTEQPHPLTTGLSETLHLDPSAGLDLLKQVDLEALEKALEQWRHLEDVSQEMKRVFKSGGNVYLVGCGATGRLALNVEWLWRHKYPKMSDRVRAFMAGGDVALVRSLEGFEDRISFGEKHLHQMGFTENDLLVAITEGGETPYVIGAALAAAETSKYKPFFLHTNCNDSLKNIDRSVAVIDDDRVTNIAFPIGPMALAGSTRMQSSTVLMLAVGFSLEKTQNSTLDINLSWNRFHELIEAIDFKELTPFTKWESEKYLNEQRVLYKADDLVLPVFTDTTERAPTFSMRAFSPNGGMFVEESSLTYVSVEKTNSADEAWNKLLNRPPNALDWEIPESQSDYIEAFDFSEAFSDEWYHHWPETSMVKISHSDCKFQISFNNEVLEIDLGTKDPFYVHCIVKILMNAHSTALMGLLGRYQSNIMTWVKPSNGKLIDRAARYVMYLLDQDQIDFIDYEEVVRQIFASREQLAEDEPIVLHAYKELKSSVRVSKSL